MGPVQRAWPVLQAAGRIVPGETPIEFIQRDRAPQVELNAIVWRAFLQAGPHLVRGAIYGLVEEYLAAWRILSPACKLAYDLLNRDWRTNPDETPYHLLCVVKLETVDAIIDLGGQLS
jgi:hypothetical protein